MMKLIDENDPAFENFCSYVCSWCNNQNRNCNPLRNCDWEDDFQRARLLLSKQAYLEDDPDHIYGSSEDDYDFEAQAKAYDAIDEEYSELKNALIKDVQINMTEYYQSFGYEM